MENKLNPAAVGAFVLVLGLALIAGVLWLAAGVGSREKTLPYRTVMTESVSGLNLNAPVKYLGVDVGKVHTIRIDPQNSRQVILDLQINTGTPVKQDSEAVLKTQGLTGIAYLEISGGTAGSAALLVQADGPPALIRSRPSLSARLENVLAGVLQSMDRVSTTLADVFDDPTRKALKQTVADTATVARALAAQEAAIGQGLQDGARTVKLTARAARELEPALARISASAKSVQAMADETRLTSQRVGLAADNAASGVQQLRSETLPELDRLIDELNAVAATVRRLGEQTERSPNSLLTGAPQRPDGPGERGPQ